VREYDKQLDYAATDAVHDGRPAIFIVLSDPPAQLDRGITGESFAVTSTGSGWRHCAAPAMPTAARTGRDGIASDQE
jgi:hypothetical protein